MKSTPETYREIYRKYREYKSGKRLSFKISGTKHSEILEKLADEYNRSVGTIHYICFDKRAKIRMGQ
jgi:hypothetical protein